MKIKKLEKNLIELGGGDLVEIFNGFEGLEAETDKEKELRTLNNLLKQLNLRVEQVKKELNKNK